MAWRAVALGVQGTDAGRAGRGEDTKSAMPHAAHVRAARCGARSTPLRFDSIPTSPDALIASLCRAICRKWPGAKRCERHAEVVPHAPRRTPRNLRTCFQLNRLAAFL